MVLKAQKNTVLGPTDRARVEIIDPRGGKRLGFIQIIILIANGFAILIRCSCWNWVLYCCVF